MGAQLQGSKGCGDGWWAGPRAPCARSGERGLEHHAPAEFWKEHGVRQEALTEARSLALSHILLLCPRLSQRLIVCLEESLYIHNIRDMKVLHTIRETPPNPTGERGRAALLFRGPVRERVFSPLRFHRFRQCCS